MNYNEELVKRLANGEEKANEEIQKMPPSVKLGLGLAAQDFKRKNEVVITEEGFTLYEKKKTVHVSSDDLGQAITNRIKVEDDEKKRQEQIRQERLEKEAKQIAERLRAGLPR